MKLKKLLNKYGIALAIVFAGFTIIAAHISSFRPAQNAYAAATQGCFSDTAYGMHCLNAQGYDLTEIDNGEGFYSCEYCPSSNDDGGGGGSAGGCYYPQTQTIPCGPGQGGYIYQTKNEANGCNWETTSQTCYNLQSNPATLSVDASSCSSASWTITPDIGSGSGSASGLLARPDNEGTDYTLTVNSPSSGANVTNSDGGGATMTVYPDDDKTFSLDCASMTGSLTPESNYCDIPLGQSVCTVNIAWDTINPQGTSAVTASGMANVNGNSGNRAFIVPHNGRTFHLFNNAQELDNTFVNAGCSSGNFWSNTFSMCVQPAAQILVTSNPSSGWTITPDTQHAVGQSGSHTVHPVNGGPTTYTITPDPIAQSFISVTNTQSGGEGNTMNLSYGDTESFAIEYMSGTLTPPTPSCIIASGQSSCNVNLTWSTVNPQGTSAITAVGMTDVNGNSGSQAFAVPIGGRNFNLYNNSHLLAQSSASSACANGTAWDGSMCSPGGSSPIGWIRCNGLDNSCSINSGDSATITWHSENTSSCSIDPTGWTGFDNPPGGNSTGPLSTSTTYSLTCPGLDGSTWNSSVTVSVGSGMSGTLTPAAAFCNIPEGQSSCNINFSWHVINPENPGGSAVTKSPNVTVGTGDDATNVPLNVKYDNETFYLYNNGVEPALAQSNVFSSCVSGTEWNGSKCVSNGTCSDGIQNGDETGIDIGGRCSTGHGGSGSCSDGVKNGNEAGIDTGGRCGTGNCFDGQQNGDETGIDTGGRCTGGGSGTCSDGVKNGNEAGIDTGGRCGTGNCFDGQQNGDETGIDTGGRCSSKQPIFIEK